MCVNNGEIAIELLWLCSIVFVTQRHTHTKISFCSMQFSMILCVPSRMVLWLFACQSVTNFQEIELFLSICARITSNMSSDQRKPLVGFIVQTTLIPLFKEKDWERNINKLCEIRLNKVAFTLPSNKNLIIITFLIPFCFVLFSFFLFLESINFKHFTQNEHIFQHTTHTHKWLLNYISWLT